MPTKGIVEKIDLKHTLEHLKEHKYQISHDQHEYVSNKYIKYHIEGWVFFFLLLG